MPTPKPRKGNRGQAHRDAVARKQAAQRAGWDANRGTPASGAPARGRRSAAPVKKQAPAPRRGLGGEQVEGRRAVRELLIARTRRVRDIWVSDTVEDSPLLAEIIGLAEDARVPVRRQARTRIEAEARTDAPQGVIAHADPLPEVDIERLATRKQPRPFLLALDGITDPHNLGALLRTAESAGVTGVVLPRHRSAHVTATVTKAAAGAVEYLPMAVVPGLPAALTYLKAQGIWTVGLDSDAEQSLFDLEVATEPVCLVLGSEGEGLSRLARQRCEVTVSIPQVGRIESLNVSAAGALACYEVARRRNAVQAP